MTSKFRSNALTDSAIAVILGGGRGTRLWPLTRYRAKPAVPLAGKYRLIDVPISNCLNSGIERIYILTQFQSSSLNQHVTSTYQLDAFSRGFVALEAAHQSDEESDWFQGTADAVRRNLKQIRQWRRQYVVILPGDTIFRIDLSEVLRFHVEREAEITICLKPTGPERASSFGIIGLGERDRVIRMTEKPPAEALPELAVPAADRARWGMDDARPYLASMGMYVFNVEVLERWVSNPYMVDFGHNILPSAVEPNRVFGYVYDGFWEDIGTIRSFFQFNLDVARDDPPFRFHDEAAPIYTHPRLLPSTLIGDARMHHTRLSEGCRIGRATFDRCVIGLRSIIGTDVELRDTVMLGADYFEDGVVVEGFEPVPADAPMMGVADGCVIEGAIIDKNARIGAGCRLVNAAGHDRYDDPEERFYIRDGIIIVPKHGILYPGTEI